MAKFTSKDLRLKDSQKVTWGTDLDANISYDGVADQLYVDVTISGVAPTQDYHLTTKYYVDNAVSGISDHGSLNGLSDDDHTQYVLVDGSRGFTSTVSGVTPTQDYHLTTKSYVDGEISTLSGSIVTDHGVLSGLSDDDHTQYVPVDGSRGFTSTVSGVSPTEDYHLVTKAYVDAGSTDRHGRQSMSLNDSTVTVSGFSALGHTNYTVNAVLENITDSDPSIYPFIVSGRASDSFTVTFAGDMDSNNYVLNWTIIED